MEEDLFIYTEDRRHRIWIKENETRILLIVQEFCPKHKPRPDKSKILWGCVAKFEINKLDIDGV